MPFISSRCQHIGESQTVALTSLAAKLKREGQDIISLGAGEPDFATPDVIAQAGIQAIKAGDTKYTAVHGCEDLRQAIADWLRSERGASYAPADIIVTTGAKYAVFQSLMAICDPGDEIIVPAPYWVSYPEMVKLADGIVRFIFPQHNNLKMSAAELEAAITPKTRALILNSPSNPSGAIYTRDELAELVQVIHKSGIYVISDEIYDQIIFDGAPFASVTEFDVIRDQLIYINGVSKSYAMTGWRIGYVAAHTDVANAIKKYQGHSTTNAATMSQLAALAAYRAETTIVRDMVQAYQQRRDYVVQRLRHINNVSCTAPAGTFYAFPDVSAYYSHDKGITNSSELCAYLLEKFNVGLVPGSAFGLDNYVRLSFATSMPVLERAMDRIAAGLHALQQ